MARWSDPRVQPLLVMLLGGEFTSENAKHLASGIFLDEGATNAFAKGLETRKRKSRQLRLSSTAPSKRLRLRRALVGAGGARRQRLV
jgi:hypothetical protein